ncbi:MAG TPA: carboxypeptidase-like regulatory domain-containing protein [Longimicrobiaceae bacterium]|nr:carboxypeptidase-like regulatory domain-containing protein [Longimicrobiaceae bacterium]
MKVLRIALVAASLLLVVRCAHVEPPSGGPEDRLAPQLLISRPDSFAVVPDWSSPVTLVFDERVSEQEIEQSIRVSPLTSPIVVDHSGDEVRVSLREGWEPGIIYHVRVVPGVMRDLFGNERTDPLTLVFSTGPEIPATRISGTVSDRITGAPVPDARVEAVRTADSLVYAVSPDSAGAFVLAYVPEGDYIVRAYLDQDLDLALDEYEPRDTAYAIVGVVETPTLDLAIVQPDSTAPVLASAAVVGEAIELKFDDYLDPDQPISTDAVSVRNGAGLAIEIASVGIGSLRDAARPEVSDTIAPPPPLPSRILSVQLADTTALVPGETYSVTVQGILNLVGLAGGGEAEFEAPEPPALPTDSLTADTTAIAR